MFSDTVIMNISHFVFPSLIFVIWFQSLERLDSYVNHKTCPVILLMSFCNEKMKVVRSRQWLPKATVRTLVTQMAVLFSQFTSFSAFLNLLNSILKSKRRWGELFLLRVCWTHEFFCSLIFLHLILQLRRCFISRHCLLLSTTSISFWFDTSF